MQSSDKFHLNPIYKYRVGSVSDTEGYVKEFSKFSSFVDGFHIFPHFFVDGLHTSHPAVL